MKIVHQIGNSQIEIKEIPTPKPGPGEILIKTVASALCGSEMSTYRKEGRPAATSATKRQVSWRNLAKARQS
jgi:threonine dehydrogenase-like Zn-dependent dehydrogenase